MWNTSDDSYPVVSSDSSIPGIFTYPPRGIALSPYSVFPRLKEKTFGPKPTKNSETAIFDLLAEM